MAPKAVFLGSVSDTTRLFQLFGNCRSKGVDILTPRKFEIHQIVEDGKDAVVLGDFAHQAKATGKIFESRFALHIEVRDGLITKYHMYEDSYAIAAAF